LGLLSGLTLLLLVADVARQLGRAASLAEPDPALLGYGP
jgi:hypothetical protein